MCACCSGSLCFISRILHRLGWPIQVFVKYIYEVCYRDWKENIDAFVSFITICRKSTPIERAKVSELGTQQHYEGNINRPRIPILGESLRVTSFRCLSCGDLKWIGVNGSVYFVKIFSFLHVYKLRIHHSCRFLDDFKFMIWFCLSKVFR